MLSKKQQTTLSNVAAMRSVAADDFADAIQASDIPYYRREERGVVIIGTRHNRTSISEYQDTIRPDPVLADLARQALGR